MYVPRVGKIASFRVPDSVFFSKQSLDILVLSDILTCSGQLPPQSTFLFLTDSISGRYHGVFKGGVRYQSGLTAAGEKSVLPLQHFLLLQACILEKKSDKEEEFRVCVIEKAANVGRHILYGSCHEPLALNKLTLVSFS